MRDEYHDLLSRIDERTKNIEHRQIEEIERMNKHSDRISSLENFRNYMWGAWAIVGFLATAAFSYVEEKITIHHGR